MFRSLLTLTVLVVSLSAFANVRVEYCFTGPSEPADIFEIKGTMDARPDVLRFRISTTGQYALAELQDGSTFGETEVAAMLSSKGLELGCFFRSEDLATDQQAYAAYQNCKQIHMGSQKTASFNTCGTPLSVCDGDPLNATPWGAGTTITLSPDPPRNPMYDPFGSPSPWVNPWLTGTNFGCLQSGEQHTIWLLMTVSSAGSLEWSLTFPDQDAFFNILYLDWSLWQFTPTICADIAANNASSAVLRCNWNDWPATPTAATGMVSNALNIPIATEEDNHELSVAANPGDQFLVLLDNWSGGTFAGTFDFSLSGGSAGVCGAVLSAGQTVLSSEVGAQGVELGWLNVGPQNFVDFAIERSADGQAWSSYAEISQQDFFSKGIYTDESPLTGASYYRIVKTAVDGSYEYSNVVQVQLDRPVGGFTISPVPSTGDYFHIKAGANANMLRVFDVKGGLILEKALSGAETDLNTDLDRGIYLFEVVESNGERFSKRVVVE